MQFRKKIAFQVLQPHLDTHEKGDHHRVGIINEKAFNKPKLNCNRLEPQTDVTVRSSQLSRSYRKIK